MGELFCLSEPEFACYKIDTAPMGDLRRMLMRPLVCSRYHYNDDDDDDNDDVVIGQGQKEKCKQSHPHLTEGGKEFFLFVCWPLSRILLTR